MTLDLIYVLSLFHKKIYSHSFLGDVTFLSTKQQPLQTTYSRLSLKHRPLGLPQSVYLREMSRCPFYQSVH